VVTAGPSRSRPSAAGQSVIAKGRDRGMAITPSEQRCGWVVGRVRSPEDHLPGAGRRLLVACRRSAAERCADRRIDLSAGRL